MTASFVARMNEYHVFVSHAFSALCVVDHRGVPNFILAEEDKFLASVYKNKSIAEQNSVDLAWNTLMEPEFEAL